MESTSWLLLLFSLPTNRNTQRVAVWRRLKKMGAVQIKTSTYLLPDEAAQYEQFQWLAQQIRDYGGDSTLVHAREIEGLTREKVITMFNDARAKDYAELRKSLQHFIARRKKMGAEEVAAELQRFTPKTIPTVTATATEAMIAGIEGNVGQCKSALIATDTPRPSKIPTAPPATHNAIASTKNCLNTSRARAPIAIRIPISCVRSVTDTSMMFMMPTPPTTSEISATASNRFVMMPVAAVNVCEISVRSRIRKSSGSPGRMW